MGKKCNICNEEAVLKIKATPDFYCQECAEENFADISLLLKVEEEARQLKKIIDNEKDPEKDYENPDVK